MVQASLLREAIDLAIRELPPEIRIVVTLFFIDDMKYREIAMIADCPIGTVMSRLARGRQLLRAALSASWCRDESTTEHLVPGAGG